MQKQYNYKTFHPNSEEKKKPPLSHVSFVKGRTAMEDRDEEDEMNCLMACYPVCLSNETAQETRSSSKANISSM
ncbi:hypothetical protein V6N12_055878 [Hibiscus sabdariffa]|uniref:Uncharacterized protein n=1 Tax=Hibiscus sabdariffa TaxID=183260 RepID=A0ABR2CQU5_9ROSI